ncbi:hypothetical protein MKK67_06020 [Methylobacterium sp. J-072]|uniref:hypothetical protein n=1 Tax=Methylobacterium sp. J-072 TaxID=2836651 RepID=UPI001FBAC780|nr:hypothetical protein [Methylobacterium sp. J-072]MCJ2092062.1 hypothetical protein [Methylobacterium sp. J-072]
MFASLATTSLAGRPKGTAPARPAVTPGRRLPGGLLLEGMMPWAAFHLLCLWTLSAPDALARMLGADGFDAGFGLGDGD